MTVKLDVQMVSLDEITLDEATQPRVTIDSATVEDYRATLEAEPDTFPPVVVFHDGESTWLADGYHRFLANQAAGYATIRAEVRHGDRRDAILHSVGANTTHGLRRSPADKRRAVETLLDNPEWSGFSDHEVARLCAVSQPFVSKLRKAGEDQEPATKNVFSQTDASGRPATNNVISQTASGRENGLDGTDQENSDPAWEEGSDPGPDDESLHYQPDPDEIEPTPRPRKGRDGRTINTRKIGRKPAPSPISGKSRVNGVLTDDPPDIAQARANGSIGPDVVPDVDEPDPDEPAAEVITREPGEDEPETDEEWLHTLPVRAKLSEVARVRFDRDALAYRSMADARGKFAHAVRSTLKQADLRGQLPPYLYRLRSFLKINDPRHWTVCPAPEHGGCGGTGEVPAVGQCVKCHGDGYTIR